MHPEGPATGNGADPGFDVEVISKDHEHAICRTLQACPLSTFHSGHRLLQVRMVTCKMFHMAGLCSELQLPRQN